MVPFHKKLSQSEAASGRFHSPRESFASSLTAWSAIEDTALAEHRVRVVRAERVWQRLG